MTTIMGTPCFALGETLDAREPAEHLARIRSVRTQIQNTATEHEKSRKQKTPSVAASGLGVRQSMMKDDLTPARLVAE
jgi:hypothetical protein